MTFDEIINSIPQKPYYRDEQADIVVYNADCRDVLPHISDKSIDLVLTDPPYGIDYQSAWRTDKATRFDVIAGDEKISPGWFTESFRITMVKGCLFCFARWDTECESRIYAQEAGYKIAS